MQTEHSMEGHLGHSRAIYINLLSQAKENVALFSQVKLNPLVSFRK